MKFSIATVSLGGTLPEKLAAIAAAGFDGVEIFEADVLAHEGSPAEIGRMVRDHGPRDRRLPAVPRLRGHARAAAQPRLRAGEAQVRADDRARRAVASSSARTSRRCRSAASTARRPTCASSAAIADGFGIEIGFEALAWGRHVSRLPRRLGGGAPRRPPAARHHPRQLPRAVARAAGRRDPRDPGRPDHLRAARRRAADGDGPAAVVAALPQLPRPGRPAGRRLHGGGARRPATTAGSATRSSTTASAWPRRGGSPRTASAR